MKNLGRAIDPLSYNCYRRYLSDVLAANGLSYRAFSALYAAYVSFPYLSKLLRKNPAGQFIREVSLRPEKLAALLKAMGLDADQISHLVLCRLNGDQVQGQYRHSAAYTQVLNGLRGPQSREESTEAWRQAVELLPNSRREKVFEVLRHQLEIEIGRTTSVLRSQRLRGILSKV